MSSAHQRPSQRIEATPATGKSLRLSPVPVERFDEYVVVARIGRGGMAEVILGLSQGLQGFRKLVALKRLHPECEENAEQVGMFLHEATLAAMLSHPNVVQTYKVGSAHGRHFIAMEYLEGQPLHRALPRLRAAGAGMDPLLAALIASDALAGLSHVHDALGYDGTPLALVHRDVSPQNLFVTYDGQVKLLDFGIAKAVALSGHTRPGLIKGKLGYIAPEQARGQVDRRADLWSVGVVLWEALAGTRLFRGEDELAQLRAILSAEIPALRTVDRDIPEALEAIVARALSRDPACRYASAEEMKSELDAWLIVSCARAEAWDPGASTSAGTGLARAALASAMQARFSDAITERRAAVLECLSAIEHEQRWLTLTQSGFDPARGSAPPDEPRQRARRKGFKLAALASGALLAGSVVLALDSGTKSRSAAPRRESANLALAAAAALPTQRVQAPLLVRVAGAGSASGRGPSPGTAAAAAAVETRGFAREQNLESMRAAAASRSSASKLALARSRETPGSSLLPDQGAASVAPARGARGRPSAAPVAPPVFARAPEGALRPLSAESREPSSADPASEQRGAPEPSAEAVSLADRPAATGRLRLEATPYALVSLDGRRLGITPIDVELPAAAHTLTLRNPERGIETTYRVQVVAGESVLRRVALE